MKKVKSVRVRLFLTLSIVTSLIILLLVFTNSIVLESFYVYSKVHSVRRGYEEINNLYKNNGIIEADEFIAVKGFKAKGKRLTTFTMETVNELEPTRQPEVPEETEDQNEEEPEILDPDHGKSEDDIWDEITGQMKLF